MIPIKRTSLLAILGLTLAVPSLTVSAATPADSSMMTRGQFIKQIADELKLAPASNQTLLPSDVGAQSPYADVARVMRERQILQGYSDGTFRLDQAVSKEEAAFILGRFLGLSDSKAAAKLKSDLAVDFGSNAGINQEIGGAAIKKALATDSTVATWLAADPSSPTELKTFRAHMDMAMDIFFKPSAEFPGDSLQTEANSELVFSANQGIHQTITTTAPGPDMKPRTVKMEQYTVSQGTYMNMPNATNDGFEWYDLSKQMPFTFDQLMELQKKSLEMNKTLVTPYFFYKDLGTTEKDGKKQRKVSIQGKLTNSADILKTLSGLGGGQDAFKDILNSPAITGMSVALSAVMTVDEQTKLPVSMDADYVIIYGEDPNIPIDHMDMTMSMTYHDVNQPQDIKLPAEAKAAKPFPTPVMTP
ncbi:S-layer homology domain-containing protein [Paenibacillus sp. HWE-109]|uniref:S-layer homology domain-containing protein n=1 Tax=Paenibacillus sp. HWE-109 TaxID=1306526 RepID=UPI001EE15413|nr:S-layer homology domain-containing protein [Paenibacillus sp. HWE-109]UKS26523.1 S-layer homology domain-containing protein [Paenibacillus sp. HWE-109]